jgi:thioredoxin
MTEILRADSFARDRLLRDGTWIVAFLADWCPFCQRFLPTFSALPPQKGFRLAVGDVTAEESPLWDDLHLDVVPTVLVFHEGRVVFRVDGILGAGLPPGGMDAARAAALATTR